MYHLFFLDSLFSSYIMFIYHPKDLMKLNPPLFHYAYPFLNNYKSYFVDFFAMYWFYIQILFCAFFI